LGKDQAFTDYFVQLVVKKSVQDAYFNHPVEDMFYRSCMEREYEQRPLQGGNQHELVWQRASISFVIAVREDLGELENFKNLHKDLRDRIRDIPELKALLGIYRKKRDKGSARQGIGSNSEPGDNPGNLRAVPGLEATSTYLRKSCTASAKLRQSWTYV